MLELLGYSGAILLLTCSLPQLIKIVKAGRADGLATGYLIMATLGMFCMFTYTLMTTKNVPSMLNFGYNFLVFGTWLRYKLLPRKKAQN